MRIRTCILALSFLAARAEEALDKAVPQAKVSLAEAVARAILERHESFVAVEYVLEDGKLAVRLTPKEGKPFTVPASSSEKPVSLPEDPFLARVCKAEMESPGWVVKVTQEEVQALPGRAEAETARLTCMNHLLQIGTGIALYADAHGGLLPGGLDEIFTSGDLADLKAFLCCEGPGKEFRTQYGYLPPPVPLPDSADPKTWIVAFDDLPRHSGKRCVLFLDRHVGTLCEEDFRKAVAAQGHPLRAAPKKP